MITLHHLNNSRSQRILWLLEELQIPYEIKVYERKNTLMAPPELKKIHPLGKAPVITDGEIVVAESGAIIEYLVETYGRGALKPKAGTEEARKYTYWLHYAEGSAMLPLILALIFKRIPKERMLFFIRPVVKKISHGVLKTFVRPQIKLHFDFIENELSKSTWMAGEEFTAADIQMSFPIEAVASRGGGDDSRPNIKKFLERIHSREAYKRAIKKGGPLDL